MARSRKPTRKVARAKASTRTSSSSRANKPRVVARAKVRAAPKSVAPVAARVASLVPEVALLPHTDPAMRALGVEVARLRSSKERDYLVRCIEVGHKLRQARTRLQHGSWQPWLRDFAKLNPRTAQRYVGLSTWAAEFPSQLRRWSPLGATKLFVIASTSTQQRAKLARLPLDELAQMGVPELRLLLGRLAGTRPPPPVAKRVDRLRRRLRGVVREVHALLDAAALDDGQIEDLRDLLKEASEALHG